MYGCTSNRRLQPIALDLADRTRYFEFFQDCERTIGPIDPKFGHQMDNQEANIVFKIWAISSVAIADGTGFKPFSKN